jgi:hypothetical protein
MICQKDSRLPTGQTKFSLTLLGGVDYDDNQFNNQDYDQEDA